MALMNRQELNMALGQFTGTESYARLATHPNVVLTDGAVFLVENADAMWLILGTADALQKVSEELGMVFITLRVNADQSFQYVMTDGDGGVIHNVKSDPGKTDFPLESIDLNAVYDGGLQAWVVMLVSEY